MRYIALVSEAVNDSENNFCFLLDYFVGSPDLENGFVTIRVSSVSDMVRQLLARLPREEDVYDSIVIQGHGSPGNQSVGDGSNYDKSGQRNLSISWSDSSISPPTTLVGNSEMKLLPLRPRLSTDCIVTLAGCNVGAGAGGRILMKIISRALGWRLVQAADALQVDYIPGMEGNVIRCSPIDCWTVDRSSWLSVPGW